MKCFHGAYANRRSILSFPNDRSPPSYEAGKYQIMNENANTEEYTNNGKWDPYTNREEMKRSIAQENQFNHIEYVSNHLEEKLSKNADVFRSNNFKANFVPAYVYEPLFAQRIEQKIRGIKHYEICTEESKKLQKCLSDFSKKESTYQNRRGDKDLKSENQQDFLHDQDALREIKRRLRAQRLLQSASLPAGMEERRHRSEMRKAEHAKKHKHLGFDDDDRSVRRSCPAPNFRKLHWETEKALRLLWRPSPEPTKPKPFQLRAVHRKRSQSSECVRPEANRELKVSGFQKAENHPPICLPRSRKSARSPTLGRNSVPPAQARVSIMRESFIRKSLEEKSQMIIKADETERQKKVKQQELSRGVRELLGTEPVPTHQLVRQTTERRKKELKEIEAARQSSYEQELEVMRERLATRPLLIAQQTQEVARRKALNRFNSILNKAGVDSGDILRSTESERRSSRRCVCVSMGEIPV